MKIPAMIVLGLCMPACAAAQSLTTAERLYTVGEPLPSVRHMIDMKIYGNTLWFVYETDDGYGQQILRRAVTDSDNGSINFSRDMGRRDDGYYVSYMPYPFIACDGTIRVISRDDCEIYNVENDTALVRTKRYLMNENSRVPLSVSHYVSDVFMTGPDNYVFVGREPNGGRQYAMTADLNSSRIDTIRQINVSAGLQTWMPNIGEMAYSDKHKRLAFAYRLHPVIEIFDCDGNLIKSVKTGNETFDCSTLDKADFEDLNPLHTVDITCTHDYIYALYWGYKFEDAAAGRPSVIKLDWDGNIIDRYTGLPIQLYRIAAAGDYDLIGWDGKAFVRIRIDK